MVETDNTPVKSLGSSEVAAEASAITPNESALKESSFLYKRKIYRQQQEEKRKVLKTARFEETEKDETVKLPKKKYYRQRAHSNPFSDHQLE